MIMTATSTAVESTTPELLDTDRDLVEYQSTTSDEESLPATVYSNATHAPSNFGDIYASVAVGSWHASWVKPDTWEYYYELSGIASFEASRIFGAKIIISEGDNAAATGIYAPADSGHVWSTNSSDGAQKVVDEAASILIDLAITALGDKIDAAWTAASAIIDLLRAGADSLPDEDNEGVKEYSWEWLAGCDKTSQYVDFRITVEPESTATITTEYQVKYGRTEAHTEWMSTGVFEYEMTTTSNPENMTPQERIANNIVTVPKDQLLYRAAEFNLPDSMVTSMLSSDQDMFYLMSSSPLCLTHQPEIEMLELQNPQTDIILLSDSNALATSLESSGVTMSVKDSFDFVDRDTVVLIDGVWADNLEQNHVTANVRNLIEKGSTVLLKSESFEILSSENTGYSSAFADDADLYGIRYDPMTCSTYCFSYIGDDSEKSIESAQSWINSFENMTMTRSSETDNEQPPPPTLYSMTKVQQNGLGEMVIETKYTKSIGTDGTTLILTEYGLTGTPYPDSSVLENNKAIADMTISCDHENSELLAYGPSFTSSSASNHAVNMEVSRSGASFDVNWNYSISECDTTVTVSGDSFTIHYDTDEYGSDKLESKIVKPGTISLATNDGYFCYQEVEHYSVNYLHDKAWWIDDEYWVDDCIMTVSIL